MLKYRYLVKFCRLLLVSIVTVSILNAQDFSSFSSRKLAVLKSLEAVQLKERGKYGLPRACARLWNNPNDDYALTYITHVLDHRNQTVFDFPGIALALNLYGKNFSPEQLAHIRSDLERLAKTGKKNGEGFLSHGTENQASLAWTSAYLFAQFFPEAKWANGMTSVELMADMKERIRKTYKNIYQKGYAEFLSPTYEIVMDFPVAILQEFAQDQEVKDMAMAYLLYKWSLLALNNSDGYILAPVARMNVEQDFSPDYKYGNPSATIYHNWLIWGWGPATKHVKLEDFQNRKSSEAAYTIYAALSNVNPNPIFEKIANVSSGTKLSSRSSSSSFGTYAGDRARAHLMLRKTYKESQFAIGSGNFRWVPGGDYADNDNYGFSIAWRSTDRFRYIGCNSPYWYADAKDNKRTPDTWKSISPFQQTVHHENTAIVLFNIPDRDPWPTISNPEKFSWRAKHATNLLKRGMVRYPKSIDEVKEHKGWIFLREGHTYIGIKPLKGYYKQDTLKGRGLDDFVVIKSDFAKTGFLFELGTENEWGSFENFQDKLTHSKLSIDWKTMDVTYLNLRSQKIRIKFNAGLSIDPDGLANSIPSVWINDKKEIPYNRWPLIDSPMIRMENSNLRITGNDKRIVVDWSGATPKISQYNTK